MNALSSREKQVVAGGAVLVLMFILVQFVYLPAHDRHLALKTGLAAGQKDLERIRNLEAQYQAMTHNTQKLDDLVRTRNKSFTLFSFLDQQAEKAGVKNHIDYMKPSSRTLENSAFTLAVVKLKLKEIVFKDFLHFISRVEDPSNGIKIASLSVTKSGRQGNLLDAVIETQTLMAKGEPL